MRVEGDAPITPGKRHSDNQPGKFARALNRALFNVENPTLARRIVTGLLVVLASLTGFGFWADYVPSDSWGTYGLAVSVILIGVALFFWYGAYRKGMLPIEQKKARKSKLVGLLLLPGILGFSIWVAVVHGVGALLADWTGSIASVTEEVEAIDRYNRSLCDHRLEGGILKRAVPWHLCLPSQYAGMVGPVTVALRGHESWFGFIIHEFELRK